MKNFNKTKSIIIALTLYFTFFAAHASLQIGSVTNLSGSNNISTADSVSITLRWSMQSYGRTGFLPGAVISSTTGTYTSRIGTVIGTNSKLLTKTITPTVNASNVNITETLRIPKSVLYTASKLGLKQIIYRRNFTDCPGSLCDTLAPTLFLTFNLTSGQGAIFGITNYKLRFDNDQVSRTIKQGEKLKAGASINVTGTGTVRGIWEIATPVTTIGNPSYRAIRTEQRQLSSFTENQITSPVLPTDVTGIYLLRFRFLNPVLDGTIPTIRYNVVAPNEQKLQEIGSVKPAKGTQLSLETVFEWKSIPGVSAYKLEFIIPPGTESTSKSASYKAIAGILVKPNETKTLLNNTVTKHLKSGRQYWWRVVGLDSSGKIIGASQWTTIKIK